MSKFKRRGRRGAKRAGDAIISAVAIGLIKALRALDPNTTANVAGWLTRNIGPLLPEHRVGRANLAAAFPEKTPDEIETILRGVWDNLGRIGAEFAHLDRLWDFDPAHPERKGRVELAPDDIKRFEQLLYDGKPALIFAAHLGNWELPAICAATYKLDSAVLYRRPNIAGINEWLTKSRAVSMGEMIPAGLDAPVKLAKALERGAHVGILVDQHFSRGVDVTFFGRPAKANPLLAQALAEVELDQNIPLELFEAAAEVIGFVLRARHRL